MRTYFSGNWIWPWVCCVACCTFTQAAHGQGIEWHEDYARSRATATANAQPMIVLIKSPDCAPCRKLEATFADSAVTTAVRKDFVALRLDSKRDAKLVEQLNIQEYPTTIFAAPDGTILHSVAGFADPTAMLGHIGKALAGLRKDSEKAPSAPNVAPSSQERQGTALSPPPQGYALSEPVPLWRTPGQTPLVYPQTPLVFPPYPSMYSPPPYWSGLSVAPSYGYPSYSAGPRRC